MDAARSTELAALVAQWHNRHPLARRITPEQVAGMGVLRLPYIVPTPAQGLLQAWRRLRRAAPPRAFDEEIIEHLKPARLAAFAWAHGAAERPGDADWPQRDMLPTRAAADTPLDHRHLRTAAIEVGGQRVRVLVGRGAAPRVLGHRLFSRRRITGGAGALVAAVSLVITLATVVGGTDRHRDAGVLSAAVTPAAAATSGPASAARVPAAASGAASVERLGAASAAGPGGASGPAPALASAAASRALAANPMVAAASGAAARVAGAATSAPVAPTTPTTPAAQAAAGKDGAAAAPSGSEGTSASLRPALPPEVRAAAKAQAEALRQGQASARDLAGAASANGPGARAASASPPRDGRVYAVATMPTKSRAASQLRIVLINAPMKAEPGQAHAEIMQIGDEFRAVIWPYHDRETAEQTRGLLAARGVKAEIIEF